LECDVVIAWDADHWRFEQFFKVHHFSAGKREHVRPGILDEVASHDDGVGANGFLHVVSQVFPLTQGKSSLEVNIGQVNNPVRP